MAKHTPGPWKIRDNMLKENREVLDRVGQLVCPHCKKKVTDIPVDINVVAGEWGVATLGSYDPKKEHEQHVANARLICAAPELLELARIVAHPHAPGVMEMAQRILARIDEEAR